MTVSRKIAFFAPIKPPDHPIPSGDRLIAENLVKAMKLGGHKVKLASRYICYSKRSAAEYLETRKHGALEEAKKVIARFEKLLERNRPEIWLTYHPYCKAPDWIGPIVSKHFDMPYVTVEAARTGQGGPEDEWREWRKEAQAGINAADLHLVFKPSDRNTLENLGLGEKLRDLAPFVDLETLGGQQTHPLPDYWQPDTPVLVTAGMMRKGKKDKNFFMLADMLKGLAKQNWNLIVIGGGPEETAIREAFSFLPDERMLWTGQVPHSQVLAWMRAGDIFVWPGWKEPIGMVYLEAQAQGLPVIAYESMGVPLVVAHGETGLLAAEGDYQEMRGNLSTLMTDPLLHSQMREAAVDKVSTAHSLEAAARTLSDAFDEVLPAAV